VNYVKKAPGGQVIKQQERPNLAEIRVLHAFANEFDYQTRKRESYWKYEDIDLKKIVELRATTSL